jgi:hypothetical protein
LDLAGSSLANVVVLCSTGVMSIVSTVVQTLVRRILSGTEPSITHLTRFLELIYKGECLKDWAPMRKFLIIK